MVNLFFDEEICRVAMFGTCQSKQICMKITKVDSLDNIAGHGC